MKKLKVWQYFKRYPQRWITGVFHERGGKCCIAGAVENQYGSGKRYHQAIERIMKVLRRRYRYNVVERPTASLR